MLYGARPKTRDEEVPHGVDSWLVGERRLELGRLSQPIEDRDSRQRQILVLAYRWQVPEDEELVLGCDLDDRLRKSSQ